MKKLKLLLLSLLFLVLSSAALGQYVPDPNKIPTVNITTNASQNGWAHNGSVCAGCPAYWYMILRSQYSVQAEDRKYYIYYFFYFYSNSHYINGSPAGTYLSEVFFYVNGNFILKSPYILLPSGQQVFGAWIRYSASIPVSFSVTNMSVQ